MIAEPLMTAVASLKSKIGFKAVLAFYYDEGATKSPRFFAVAANGGKVRTSDLHGERRE